MIETTVIVGGGVIGLWCAYCLAQRLHDNTSHRVIVVDALDYLWDSASSNNSGILSKHLFETFDQLKGFRELGLHSFELYRSLRREDADFVSYTSIESHSCYKIYKDGDGEVPSVPGWLRPGKDWRVELDPKNGEAMTINPLGLVKWLLNRLLSFNVQIIQSATLTAAELDDHGKTKAVSIIEGLDPTKRTLSCQHLVLAAGAWTPSLVETLFPHSDIDLKAEGEGGSWMIIKNPDTTSPPPKQAFLYIPENEGHIEILSRADGTIWICGAGDKHDMPPSMGRSGTFEPIQSSAHYFRLAAHQYVKQIHDGSAKLEIVREGFSYRPLNKLMRPVVCAVPCSRLTKNASAENDMSGVFICTGHAWFGITLGLGTGDVLSALVTRETPGIDMSKLRLPDPC